VGVLIALIAATPLSSTGASILARATTPTSDSISSPRLLHATQFGGAAACSSSSRLSTGRK